MRAYPLEQLDSPSDQIKYGNNASFELSAWSWFQYVLTVTMMLHMFTVLGSADVYLGYMYCILLLIQIFSITSLLDNMMYSLIAEAAKGVVMGALIYIQEFKWYGLPSVFVYMLIFYMLTSFGFTYYFLSGKLKLAKK